MKESKSAVTTEEEVSELPQSAANLSSTQPDDGFLLTKPVTVDDHIAICVRNKYLEITNAVNEPRTPYFAGMFAQCPDGR